MSNARNGEMRYPYSDRERAMLKVLKQQPTTIKELIEVIYKNREKPLTARSAINSNIQMLKEKIERNKEPYRIVFTKQHPRPTIYQIEEIENVE